MLAQFRKLNLLLNLYKPIVSYNEIILTKVAWIHAYCLSSKRTGTVIKFDDHEPRLKVLVEIAKFSLSYALTNLVSVVIVDSCQTPKKHAHATLVINKLF